MGLNTQSALPLLRRMLLIAIFAAVFMSAVAYPLRLPDSVLQRFEHLRPDQSVIGWIYHTQLRSQVAFNHSPLVYKECIAQAYLLFALVCFLLTLVLRGLAGGLDQPTDLRQKAQRPGFWIVLLLAFTGAAAVIWSPTFHYSVRTYLGLATGIVMFAALSNYAPTRRTCLKFMTLLSVAGFLAAAVSLMQHINAADWFMPIFKDEPRNRIGSLLGHNTGLSSWLLFPLSFTLFGLFTARRARVRLISAATAALILFIIVAAQSRAIWILGGLMLVTYIPTLLHLTGRRPGARVWLIAAVAVLLIVAVQIAAPDRNPFARHIVSLKERVRKDLADPAQLLRETRLRIVLSSGLLIMEKPIIGHGTGAFQFVYPPAQGRFLKDKPDTKLGLTTKRTDLAHNDYLQFLVECGLIGSLLLAVPLFLAVRAGLRVYRFLPIGRDKAMLAAIMFPAAAVSVHAFVDFPMHIVPIALAEVLCLGLWYRADSLTGTADITGTESPTPESTETDPPPAVTPPPAQGPRIAVIAGLTSLIAGIILSGLGYVFIYREFASDIYFCDAQNWVSTYRTIPADRPNEQLSVLSVAVHRYGRALRTSVFNGQAMEGRAYAESAAGRIYYNLATSQSDPAKAAALLQDSRKAYERAVQTCTDLLKLREFRWHYTYYLIGQGYKMLWRINLVEGKNRPETPYYLESAKRSFLTAIDINIADATSHFELADLYEKQPSPDPGAAAKHRRIILAVDPYFARDTLFAPVMLSAKRGDFDDAFSRLRTIQSSQARHWMVTCTAAELHLRKASWPTIEVDRLTSPAAVRAYAEPHLAQGEALLNSLAPADAERPEARKLRIFFHASRGRFDQALNIADEYAKEVPLDYEVAGMRVVLAKKLGTHRSIAPASEVHDIYYFAVNHARLFHTGDELLGASQYTDWAKLGKTVPLDDGLRAAQLWVATDRFDYARILADRLAKLYPRDPAVAKLQETLKEKTP